MKLRHKVTGEILDLPDFLPEFEDAKEIARVFQEAKLPSEDYELPLDIISLKTYSGDIIQVKKITGTPSHFPYEKLIQLHLHLPPFKYTEKQDKSTVWSVLVNGKEWCVGDTVYQHEIQKLEWTAAYGWWAITNTVYAIQLNKIAPEEKMIAD